jgi:segregation and condensation protein B
MTKMTVDQQIEAVLFYKAVPMKKATIAKLFGVGDEEVGAALKVLQNRLESGATTLVMTDDEVELVIAPEFDALIENLRKDELKRDIGKAGAETLAIVLYRSPITRGEIDRIRGVNSSYILRALETRGLIERSNKTQRNEFIPTTTLMRHLGIQEKTGLSDYANVMNALENFEKQQELEND